jgi:uncharacterized protein YkuJ
MPAGVNSHFGLGIRRLIYSLPEPEYRNFEVNGQQLYRVVTAYTYSYAGSIYPIETTIPFDSVDINGAPIYSNAEQLERDFNQAWIDPID